MPIVRTEEPDVIYPLSEHVMKSSSAEFEPKVSREDRLKIDEQLA
jgi:hypothetical protein